MKITAKITEIFSSLQGEGPYTGKSMTFVRFSGCSLGCRWCDTDMMLGNGSSFRVETPPASKNFLNRENPVDIDTLNSYLSYFTDPVISVTGGEPLEQALFLKDWLPTLHGKKKILLETNGIHYEELDLVSRYIDIISMDIKLPSSTGGPPRWQEHSSFIAASLRSGKELYIKMVLTGDTSNKDIQEAIRLISSSNKYVPVVLQPVSCTDRFCRPVPSEQVESLARICNSWLPNVSIMHQAHKSLGIL